MASTQNTLRTRQNMEILDVWKNLSSQVNALTKRQVAVFPDTAKPKTQRDMEVEVNVDKAVESLNNALETRLGSLEFVLKNDSQLQVFSEAPPIRRRIRIEDSDGKAPSMYMTKQEILDEFKKLTKQLSRVKSEGKVERAALIKRIEALRGEQRDTIKLLPFQNSYQEIINTGSIVSLWNSIVRYYQKVGLSRQSQEMVKVKVQDLVPNLEAIVYGVSQAVDVLFANNKYNDNVGLKILELLRTQSVYQLIKRQVDTSAFEVISVFPLDTAFKNIFAELSEERRELLGELTNKETGSISTRPIRSIPHFQSGNFEERMKALSDEMGIHLEDVSPSVLEKLRQMNQTDFERYAGLALQSIQKTKGSLSARDATLEGERLRLVKEIGGADYRLNTTIPREIQGMNEMIRRIDDDDLKEPPADEPLIDVGNEPEPPNPEDYFEAVGDEKVWNEEMGPADLDEAMIKFEADLETYRQNVERNYSITLQNRLNRIARQDIDTQQEERANLVREVQELEDEIPRLEEYLALLFEEERLYDDDTALYYAEALDAIIDVYAGTKLQKTKGKGRHSDIAYAQRSKSRGLAGMGSHYGAEDDSESDGGSEIDSDEEDPLAFDDRRNDSYYTRPIVLSDSDTFSGKAIRER